MANKHIQFKNVTGAVAIASTLAPAVPFRLLGIRIHLSAAGGAGNFTVQMDASAGAAYDTVLFTQDMTSVVDLEWQPDSPMEFAIGDELDFAWANASTRTYGMTIIYEID